MSKIASIAEASSPGVAAAMWWAEQIGAPVHKIVRDDAAGADREIGDFTFLTMQLVSGRHPVSEEQGQKFVEALAPGLDEALGRCNRLSLGVDYGPDLELSAAAEAAGVNPSRFPFKTHMWLRPDHVTAALGYGAWPRLIWSSPAWVRGTCGQHDWTDDGPRDVVCSKPLYHEPDHGEWVDDPERCEVCADRYSEHYNSRRKDHTWKPRRAS